LGPLKAEDADRERPCPTVNSLLAGWKTSTSRRATGFDAERHHVVDFDLECVTGEQLVVALLSGDLDAHPFYPSISPTSGANASIGPTS